MSWEGSNKMDATVDAGSLKRDRAESYPRTYPNRRFKSYSRMRQTGTATADTSWDVQALCKAYHWPPKNLTGRGTIAIVELDGGWTMEDMKTFFSQCTQPMPDIENVTVDGTKNHPNGPDNDPKHNDIEVALDIQVAAASYFAATGKPASIRVYWSQDI